MKSSWATHPFFGQSQIIYTNYYTWLLSFRSNQQKNHPQILYFMQQNLESTKWCVCKQKNCFFSVFCWVIIIWLCDTDTKMPWNDNNFSFILSFHFFFFNRFLICVLVTMNFSHGGENQILWKCNRWDL